MKTFDEAIQEIFSDNNEELMLENLMTSMESLNNRTWTSIVLGSAKAIISGLLKSNTQEEAQIHAATELQIMFQLGLLVGSKMNELTLNEEQDANTSK